jgi:hypothetical protein
LHLKKGILEEKREQWRKSINIVAEATKDVATDVFDLVSDTAIGLPVTFTKAD